MRKFLYVVYDSVAAQADGPVVVLPNDAAARRVFQDAVMDPNSRIAQHPADYVLMRLASFDDETLKVEREYGQVLSGDIVVEMMARRDGSQVPQDNSQLDVLTPTVED